LQHSSEFKLTEQQKKKRRTTTLSKTSNFAVFFDFFAVM